VSVERVEKHKEGHTSRRLALELGEDNVDELLARRDGLDRLEVVEHHSVENEDRRCAWRVKGAAKRSGLI
jgi:hypothetical protein